MTFETKYRQKIEDYLLNRSSEKICQEIEEKLITDDEFYDFFLTVECDLFENYLDGNYSEKEKESFEKYFLAHPQRKHDLWLTENLTQKAKAKSSVKEVISKKDSTFRGFDFRKLFPILAPSFAMLLIAVGGFIWWNYSQNSDLDKGLAALKDSYKNERPLQSRISDFEYSPFVQKRGNEQKNSSDLRIAETFLLQAVKNVPNSDSYAALGKFYLTSKNFEKAIENFNSALKLDASNPKLNNNLGVSWLEKGKFDLSQDKGKAAIDFAESLKYFNKAISLDKNLPEAFFNRSETYQNLYLPEKAVEDLQNYLKQDSNSRWSDEARERLKILEDQKAKVSLNEEQINEKFKAAFRDRDEDHAWQMIKLARSRTGNFIVQKLISDFLSKPPNDEDSKKDLTMMKFAADVEKNTVGDFFSSDLVSNYSNITPAKHIILIKAHEAKHDAQLEYQKSNYQTSADKYAEAKKIFTDAGNIPEALQAETWISFSNLRIPQNQGKNEILEFNRLAKIFESKNYLSLQGQVFDGLGDILVSSGDFSKSLEARQKSIELAKKVQDAEMIARIHTAFSSRNLSLGKYRKSLESLFFAFEAQRDFHTKPIARWTPYYITAMSFYLEGFSDVAFAYQEKSLLLAEESGLPLYKSRSFAQSALFYLMSGEYENAIKSGEMAISVGDLASDIETRLNIESNVSILLADTYRKAGQYQKSLDYYNRSEAIYKKINFQAELYQIYRGKAMSYMALDDNNAAERELNESINQYENFRNMIYEESSKNQFFDVEQGIYDVAVNFAHNRLKNSQLALDYAEKNRARSLLNLTQTQKIVFKENDILLKSMSEPKSISELQNRIPETSQILEYSLLEDKIIAWIITKNSFQTTETKIDQNEFQTKIRRYLQILQAGDETTEGELQNLAKEIYRTLISPNEKFLDSKKSLYFVPDKDLNFLPFASLLNTETNKYLIEEFQIGITPSLNIFVLNSNKANEKSNTGSEKLMIVGNPSFNQAKHQDLSYLPAAKYEAEKISSFYDSTTILVEKKATRQNVLDEIQNAEILHFASHAVMDEYNPLLSSLILADSGGENDDSLSSEKIYGLKLPKAKLVVLSACQTGIERAFRGEGAIGLARPFIALGVPSVIASLWQVESSATAELMINFHRFRKQENLKTSEALQKAQLEMIHNQNKSFRQPREWASFIIIGGETNY